MIVAVAASGRRQTTQLQQRLTLGITLKSATAADTPAPTAQPGAAAGGNTALFSGATAAPPGAPSAAPRPRPPPTALRQPCHGKSPAPALPPAHAVSATSRARSHSVCIKNQIPFCHVQVGCPHGVPGACELAKQIPDAAADFIAARAHEHADRRRQVELACPPRLHPLQCPWLLQLALWCLRKGGSRGRGRGGWAVPVPTSCPSLSSASQVR